MRAALLTHVLPGAPSGQGVMLGRMLPGFSSPPLVIASPRAMPTSIGAQPELSIAALPPDIPRRGGATLLPLIALGRARRIARLLREHRVQALVACTGDLLDLPAGSIAARKVGIPFVPWLFDPYAGQWPGRAMNVFATVAERLALRDAAHGIVPNEFARRLYEQRYRMPVSIVRNPLAKDYPFYRQPAVDRKHIRYTGAVYRVNGFALGELARALDKPPGGAFVIDIVASRDTRYLDILGGYRNVRRLEHVSEVEATLLQQSAGILYLPLGRRREFASVTSPITDASLWPTGMAQTRALLTTTAAPAKLGEYLASGRPILACVPSNTFIAWYLRRYDAGLTVTEPTRDALAAAVETLDQGGPAIEQMSANARTRAACDFAPETAWSGLRTVLNSFG